MVHCHHEPAFPHWCRRLLRCCSTATASSGGGSSSSHVGMFTQLLLTMARALPNRKVSSAQSVEYEMAFKRLRSFFLVTAASAQHGAWLRGGGGSSSSRHHHQQQQELTQYPPLQTPQQKQFQLHAGEDATDTDSVSMIREETEEEERERELESARQRDSAKKEGATATSSFHEDDDDDGEVNDNAADLKGLYARIEPRSERARRDSEHRYNTSTSININNTSDISSNDGTGSPSLPVRLYRQRLSDEALMKPGYTKQIDVSEGLVAWETVV
eukprot:m.195537 g.195537  ORF g.195537 m.195537 type:complete len:272 (+) comp17638_c0_seq4:4199-5014(+)